MIIPMTHGTVRSMILHLITFYNNQYNCIIPRVHNEEDYDALKKRVVPHFFRKSLFIQVLERLVETSEAGSTRAAG